MPDQYKSWMSNPNISSSLNGYRLGDLNDAQQELLEKAYCSRRGNNSSDAGKSDIGKLSREVQIPPLMIKQAIASIIDISNGLNISNSGTDPQVFSGDGHYNGLSRPQSLE